MNLHAGRSGPVRGAEATIHSTHFLGAAVLEKHRVRKGYRHDGLDARLRDERTRDEANLLAAARRAGVPVPVVLDVDRKGARLLLEPVEGRLLRDMLADAQAAERMRALGQIVARLHDAGIAHGDLTPSNVLARDGGKPSDLVLLDFGLGQFTEDIEARGVDLHLVEETLAAGHPDAAPLIAAFLDGYRTGPNPEAALRRLEEIRQRGRYRV